jgi:hypothetical protein
VKAKLAAKQQEHAQKAANTLSAGELHPAIAGGIETQLIGDGHRHFRRLSVINFASKVVGIGECPGSAEALVTAAMWEGEEKCGDIAANTRELRETFRRRHESGLQVGLGSGTPTHMPVKFVGGGDMKRIATCLGISGRTRGMWHLQEKGQFHECKSPFRRKATAMCCHLARCSHSPADFNATRNIDGGERTGLHCPGCNKVRATQVELDAGPGPQTAEEARKCRRGHCGRQRHKPPLFPFIELRDFHTCTPRLLLRVMGAMWKNFIGSRIVAQGSGANKKTAAAVAENVTELLHKKMHVRVPPPPRAVTGGEVKTGEEHIAHRRGGA